MVFLGFSAGLPFLLIAGTLTAWLTIARISMAEVGMFAWVGILYSLKFLWAPLVDRLPVPFLTRWMGRRRSWMLLAQLGVGLSVAAIAYSEPSTNLTMIAWFAVLTAFAGATQDIVIDAYRIEAVEQKGWRLVIRSATGWASLWQGPAPCLSLTMYHGVPRTRPWPC
jgi:PAT family beta-lactamase induction signal transducer AmpG